MALYDPCSRRGDLLRSIDEYIRIAPAVYNTAGRARLFCKVVNLLRTKVSTPLSPEHYARGN